MKTPDSDRNLLLRQALERGAGCPPLVELLEKLLPGAEGARDLEASSPRALELRAHADTCPACAAELVLADAFDATPKSAAEEKEIAWVAAQIPLGAPAAPAPQLARVLPLAPHAAKRAREARAARRGEGPSLGKRWAAAALIVVGLGVAFEWAHRSLAPDLPGRSDALSPDVVRSGDLRLEAPVGILELPGVDGLPPFAWRPLAGAASYRIDVRDVAGELLWQGTTPGTAATTLPVPQELRTKLATLVTYRWNVTALDDSERVVGHSSPASFRVEPPAN